MNVNDTQAERRAADKRLLRTYGISLQEYEARLAGQAGVCAICQRPPVNYRLNVDHDHRFDRVKIAIRKNLPGWPWMAECADPMGILVRVMAATRAIVRTMIRMELRRKSVRGLLCMQCNKGLQYFRDSADRLDRAAAYLRRFNALVPERT